MKTVADELGSLDIELFEPPWRWSTVALLCRTCAFTPQTSEEKPVRRYAEPYIARWERHAMPEGSRRIRFAGSASAIVVPFSTLPFERVGAHLLHEVYPEWDARWMDRAVRLYTRNPAINTEPI